MPALGHTAWLLAEHLSHDNPVLDDAGRVLLIESDAAMNVGPVHRQKIHLILVALRTFADELRERGVEVDLRRATTYREGVAAHRSDHGDPEVRLLRPTGPRAREGLRAVPGVVLVEGTLFLTTDAEFETWAGDRGNLVMEGFYRWQRRRLDLLMDGDEPVEGRWNFDAENRGKPGKDVRPPEPWTPVEGPHDREVRAQLDRRDSSFGDDGPRRFPASAIEARAALAHFIEHRLPSFGMYQDAMLGGERFMWHAALAAAMNLGLLAPLEMVRAADDAYRAGHAPIASVEGFVRQIIGWREYVRAVFNRWESDWPGMNGLDADRTLPAVFWGGPTEMRCMADAIGGLVQTGYAHHIERLMLFGNLQMLLGVRPAEALHWFHHTHVDGHAWVMAPNVLGMALHADGGRMMTKPYAASGAYIKRMSDHCGGCRYDPSARHGPDACPFTTLYWDFLARHRARFMTNGRMALSIRNLDRIPPPELSAIRRDATRLRNQFSA